MARSVPDCVAGCLGGRRPSSLSPLASWLHSLLAKLLPTSQPYAKLADINLRIYVQDLLVLFVMMVTEGQPLTVLEASIVFLSLTTLVNPALPTYKEGVVSYGRKQSPAEWCRGCKV